MRNTGTDGFSSRSMRVAMGIGFTVMIIVAGVAMLFPKFFS